MKTNTFIVVLFAFLIGLLSPAIVQAHCDSMDGPVVKAAIKALETGNVNHVLVWVQKKDEQEIRAAFEKTLAVRISSPAARELADGYFFETLVRIHRAGEGAPYTGLKPAGSAVEPGIEAADRAIEKGSGEDLLKELTETMHSSLHDLLSEVNKRRNFKPDDVEAGRNYVKAYVTFIHYVEQVHRSLTSAGAHETGLHH